MEIGVTPDFIVWDITYACPLRCTHCYSKSGRRESRQLDADNLFQLVDVFISLKPKGIAISGGEPLLVKDIFEIGSRLSKAGIELYMYTSGWALSRAMLPSIMALFSKVAVSVDGATAEVHDRIRGRVGSFERAMQSLGQLNQAIRDCKGRGERPPVLGIEYVVARSNFGQLEDVCAGIAPRFSELKFIAFGAVIPSGLASRIGFVDHEMLTDEQEALLSGGQLEHALQSLAPCSVKVSTTDNRDLQMHPDRLAAGGNIGAMHVEPDGMVRAMSMYEGTVGSLLVESPSVLWERAVCRVNDPLVTGILRSGRSVKAWAEGARYIDQHFGSAAVKARIARRPAYTHNFEATGTLKFSRI